MDIEGYEYAIMANMLQSNHLIPDQISVELHIKTSAPFACDTPQGLATFMSILHGYGYLLLDRHDNSRCQSCSEVLLGRVYC